MTYIPTAIQWARRSSTPPPFVNTNVKPRGRKRLGVKYEQAVQRELISRFAERYTPSPWIRFADTNGSHWCQPDGILQLTPDCAIIVEVKYQHTIDAWYQLRQLYEPVVRALLPETYLATLEIVRWYDCATAFPEPARLVKDVETWDCRGFGVHIWKP